MCSDVPPAALTAEWEFTLAVVIVLVEEGVEYVDVRENKTGRGR